jgi:pyranose oxidase
MSRKTDILIIGSGPVGATYARLLSAKMPNASILMVDAGPRLTERAGQHVKNITDPAQQAQAQIRSQGDRQEPYPNISVAERARAVQEGRLTADLLARAGTHLATPNADDLAKNEMPAISFSTCVGGMGAHWTCACPRPGEGENIKIIPADELEKAYLKAEELLCVTQKAFPASPEGNAIQQVLGQVFNKNLSKNRRVQPMPLACSTGPDGERYWTGVDTILGKLATGKHRNFELRAETLCQKLLHRDGKITGAWLKHLPSGKRQKVEAQIVIVAADALRTPQLLWASGIRPKALGRYLNEHPFVFTFVELKPELVDRTVAGAYDPNTRSEPTIGVFWVPFEAPKNPFHGQVMHMDLSPMKTTLPTDPRHIVGLGWGPLKQIRRSDRIVFSGKEKDAYGLPKMNFKFAFTKKDLQNIENARAAQAKAIEAFGKTIREGEQTLMPPGTSLHYECTTRIGTANDGTSVCDTYSKVWGFENLYVGGNGVLPTPTASNPTLTSVALAVRACEQIFI